MQSLTSRGGGERSHRRKKFEQKNGAVSGKIFLIISADPGDEWSPRNCAVGACRAFMPDDVLCEDVMTKSESSIASWRHRSDFEAVKNASKDKLVGKRMERFGKKELNFDPVTPSRDKETGSEIPPTLSINEPTAS
jgi:hypothetical protein